VVAFVSRTVTIVIILGRSELDFIVRAIFSIRNLTIDRRSTSGGSRLNVRKWHIADNVLMAKRMLIGDARVSTVDQNLALQRDALTEAGCPKIFHT
jgi:hypothetical protein